MLSLKPISICLLAWGFTWTTSAVLGQEAVPSTTDNEPIYLDEPEQEPPARVARRSSVKQQYTDGTPRSERGVAQLSDDRVVNDGKYIEYYRDGQKYVEGTYKLGVFDGQWQYWYPNGQLCKTVTFQDGQPHGTWDVFDKDGKLLGKKSYQNGHRHGHWITYYPGGETPKLELHYEAGTPSGERISYYENGQKRQLVNFKDGKMNGTMTEWEENGEKRAEATFVDGKMEGQVQRFGN